MVVGQHDGVAHPGGVILGGDAPLLQDLRNRGGPVAQDGQIENVHDHGGLCLIPLDSHFSRLLESSVVLMPVRPFGWLSSWVVSRVLRVA